ncbi:predicted protein [Plenodomus lingam JN3]|uniref:Predicted protein n=1 Tax=Leptosphaeria maculans (strain JN3 / isolate v23.1.3 / race Av1-4-5-6-7-8) TaxID=985895 RepID=E5A8R5_LEPMJ|nr:predicted protein [Plenodomus lingam JN3]CBY00010.1 predicted protein [Plenodomus lingam JN3]
MASRTGDMLNFVRVQVQVLEVFGQNLYSILTTSGRMQNADYLPEPPRLIASHGQDDNTHF